MYRKLSRGERAGTPAFDLAKVFDSLIPSVPMSTLDKIAVGGLVGCGLYLLLRQYQQQ